MFIKLELLKDIASKKQYFGKCLAEVFVHHWMENFDFDKFIDNISWYMNRYVDGKWYVYFPDGSVFICTSQANGLNFEFKTLNNFELLSFLYENS